MKMLLFEMYEFQVVNLLGGVSSFVIVFIDEFKHFIVFQKFFSISSFFNYIIYLVGTLVQWEPCENSWSLVKIEGASLVGMSVQWEPSGDNQNIPITKKWDIADSTTVGTSGMYGNSGNLLGMPEFVV